MIQRFAHGRVSCRPCGFLIAGTMPHPFSNVVSDMDLHLPGKTSAAKAEILNRVHRYLYPGRVERMLDGGIDFVPGRREGYRYQDTDGRELLDLHLNGGTFNLGHRNPELCRILVEGLADWDIGNHHFASAPKAALAKALVESAPGRMQYAVLTSSGSEAIDVAIKSARQATGRKRVVALDTGYHGRTGLSGAAGDDQAARYFLSDQPGEFCKVPFNDLDAMRRALSDHDVAAVLLETIPATSGFQLPHDHYLPGVKALCEQFGSLYIADEVQTGLGRTGRMWAVEHWDLVPDILVTGKGLSGGLYPIAAAVLSEPAGRWLNDNGWGHVSTFGGSDLGCLVAVRVLQICSAPATLANANDQADYLLSGLQELAARFPFLEEIRHKGLVMALKFTDETTGLGMMRALYENGIWAIVAGFDQAIIQFKPGLLIEREYCDEVLSRVENACIWFLAALNEIMGGGTASSDDAYLQPVKRLAQQALSHWNLDDAGIDVIKHRENTVFKVTAGDGRCFVLRVHRAGYHSDAALKSELTWMRALRDHGISVPAVVPTRNGKLFVWVGEDPDRRQCDLFEWIEGRLFNDLGRVERGMKVELCERYERLGALAARLHTQAVHWQPPADFVRHSWDENGLLGEQPLWGRFWEHPVITPGQKREILQARLVLQEFLKKFGKSPDKYGLIHADFLPENILVHAGEMNLIDFDDCGYGWHLFEMATSLFPQINQPFFDDLVTAFVAGYRSERDLSEADLEVFPAFLMMRGFTYLGWLLTRGQDMKYGDRLAQEIVNGLVKFIPELMQELTPFQRLMVGLMARLRGG
jgi:acetylornithine/succinyldiaminopimelate/putrescine aminotransferase/Ser/Thr protein kinase RdoA (MazF antagonist)